MSTHRDAKEEHPISINLSSDQEIYITPTHQAFSISQREDRSPERLGQVEEFLWRNHWPALKLIEPDGCSIGKSSDRLLDASSRAAFAGLLMVLSPKQ